ncbi:MAG: DNA-packaging protein [Candidatus Marinimicrobia bacterium]|nr:DNA-packaging protein [Candidatus Neomarinimicrobiota bacterium]
MVHPGGRPRKFTKKRIKEISNELDNYIEESHVPILAHFAYKNNIPRHSLYDYPEFSTLIKKCIDKKESALELGMLSGEMPPAAAIFSLKQLGWSDKQEIAHSGRDGGPIRITTADDLTDDELANIAAGSRK